MPTYTDLINDLIAAAENDAQEFVNYCPNMINRTEERLTRDLDDYGLVAYTSITMGSGIADVSAPAGTRIVKNLNIQSNGSKINLLLRTDEFLNDYWPVESSVGTPKYYAKLTDTLMRVAPTPTSAFSSEIVHISRPTTLTSASNTNYFTDMCYDALFFGCMAEAMMFTKNFSVLPVYEERYKNAVEALRNQARRTRRDDMQTPASPAGGDNTITGAN